MFCRNCGAQIADHVKFCPACGKPVSSNTSSAQPKQPQQPVMPKGHFKKKLNLGNFIVWAGCLAAFISLFLNLSLIHICTTANAAAGEYIFPNSDKEYLTDADVSGLSKADLRLARNEILARHGRIFNSADLKTYFEGKSWYSGDVYKRQGICRARKA